MRIVGLNGVLVVGFGKDGKQMGFNVQAQGRAACGASLWSGVLAI